MKGSVKENIAKIANSDEIIKYFLTLFTCHGGNNVPDGFKLP